MLTNAKQIAELMRRHKLRLAHLTSTDHSWLLIGLSGHPSPEIPESKVNDATARAMVAAGTVYDNMPERERGKYENTIYHLRTATEN